MGRLDGKVIVITGASSGIGKQTTIRVAEEGAKVAICDIQEEKLMETKRLCQKKGAEVLALRCDVMRHDDLKAFVDEIAKRFGVIDCLVNNAHTIATPRSFFDYDEEILNTEMQSGFYATWRMMKLCFPYMKDKGGSIINFGSGAGVIGMAGYAAYAAAKEAIRALSRVLANEWGQYNIRVNVICPAVWTDTLEEGLTYLGEGLKELVQEQMSNNPFHKCGDPYNHVAPVVVFLASEDSAWMTGQTFNVEGGCRITA